jgi:hypothetical protein
MGMTSRPSGAPIINARIEKLPTGLWRLRGESVW